MIFIILLFQNQASEDKVVLFKIFFEHWTEEEAPVIM